MHYEPSSLLVLFSDPIQEANTKVINLEEDDERAVHAIIESFYTGTYTSPVAKASGDQLSPMSHDIPVYHRAKKYMLDETLVKTALLKSEEHILKGWSSAAFANALEEAFDSVPADGDDLTKAVTQVAKVQVVALYTWPTDGCLEFRRVIRNIPVLAAELAESLAHQQKVLLSNQEKTTRKSNLLLDIKCLTPTCANRGPITFSLPVSANSTGNAYCPFCVDGKAVADWQTNY